MGVRGLSSYLESKKRPWRRRRLRDGPIVVDGSSLAARVCSDVDMKLLGDYSRLAEDLDAFFDALRDCDLRPVVVCDGGCPPNKVRQTLTRIKQRWYMAFDRSAFPLMLRDLLFSKLAERRVDFVVCRAEADAEIAAVAKLLDAPALSLDSDFCIYDVEYAPVHRFEITPTIVDGEKAIECSVISRRSLGKALGIDERLLPLLAALLGNDYVRRATFGAFLRQLPDHKKGRVDSLVRWLANETYESAVKNILSRFKLGRRERVRAAIEKCYKIYSNPRSEYASDLNLPSPPENRVYESDADSEPNLTESESEDSIDVRLTPTKSSVFIPHWLSELFKTGRVSPKYLDVLNYSTYVGLPQIEDPERSDACTQAFPIIRYNYDLMTRFCDGREIDYMGRKGRRLCALKVKRCFHLPRKLRNELREERRPDGKFFFEFLRSHIGDESIAKIIAAPAHAQLVALAIVWLRTRSAHDDAFGDAHAYALILNLAALNLNCTQGGRPKRRSNSELSGYFDFRRKQAVDVGVLHGFAQFQCCLQQFSYLNALVGSPLAACDFGKVYCGAFACNAHDDIARRKDPRKRALHVLGNSPQLLDYFERLEDATRPGSAEVRKSSKIWLIFLVFSLLALFALITFWKWLPLEMFTRML